MALARPSKRFSTETLLYLFTRDSRSERRAITGFDTRIDTSRRGRVKAACLSPRFSLAM
jgi:hypothetical protein